MMPTIALIPARGGSKRIPKKNLVDLGGKPLIAWSIAWALQEPAIDHVAVSTEDEEIMAVARECFQGIPMYRWSVIRRPIELAKDDTPDLPVFQHALAVLSDMPARVTFVHVRPTTPFRRYGLAGELLQASMGRAVRSVRRSDTVPYKLYAKSEKSGEIWPVAPVPGLPEAHNMPKQELPESWQHDGALDIIPGHVIKSGSMTGMPIFGWENDFPFHIDIDEPEDLERARAMVPEVLALREAVPA